LAPFNSAILFVTDNNSFDKLSIDYLEYDFIQKFKASSCVLLNKDLRPNVSVYDFPNVAFKLPLAPADLITGLAENGWKFFKGLKR
jgi:hypothetical protein